MKIFVIGHKGSLGQPVYEKLKEFETVTYDLVDGEDILDYEKLKEKMSGCDTVVHMANIPTPNKGVIEDYFRVNVVGTFNVLRAAKENKVKRVIYFSSVNYYGCAIDGKLFPLYLPIDEKHPTAITVGEGGLDPYDTSKMLAETLCAYYGSNKMLEVIALRISPANNNEVQYPSGFSWQDCTRYQRHTFWSNCPPSLVEAVYKCVISTREFGYTAYNLANDYTDAKVPVTEFLEKEYPELYKKADKEWLKTNPCLISTKKIREEVL